MSGWRRRLGASLMRTRTTALLLPAALCVAACAGDLVATERGTHTVHEANPLARLAARNVASVAVDPLPVYVGPRIERQGDIEYRIPGRWTAPPWRSCTLDGERAWALVEVLARAVPDPDLQSGEGGFRVAIRLTDGSEMLVFLPQTASADQSVPAVGDIGPHRLRSADFGAFQSRIAEAGCAPARPLSQGRSRPD